MIAVRLLRDLTSIKNGEPMRPWVLRTDLEAARVLREGHPELSIRWRRRFLEDLRAAGQQRWSGKVLRQLLVSADYQIAAR